MHFNRKYDNLTESYTTFTVYNDIPIFPTKWSIVVEVKSENDISRKIFSFVILLYKQNLFLNWIWSIIVLNFEKKNISEDKQTTQHLQNFTCLFQNAFINIHTIFWIFWTLSVNWSFGCTLVPSLVETTGTGLPSNNSHQAYNKYPHQIEVHFVNTLFKLNIQSKLFKTDSTAAFKLKLTSKSRQSLFL